MVKLRLMRAGARKRPFYRIVAIDQRDRRDGRPLEFLGTYDPLTQPERVALRADRIEVWLARGAQMSDAVRALMRRARRVTTAGASAPEEAPAASAGEGAV